MRFVDDPRLSPVLVRVCLFSTVFCFFLLFSSREKPWNDAKPIYEVAESLAEHGELSIQTRWPVNLPIGRDGQLYASAPLLQSLVHVPGAYLRKVVLKRRPELFDLSRSFACHTGPAALAGLIAVLTLGMCLRLGVSAALAWWATAAVVLGSYVALYGRYPYSEILQTACFTGFFASMLRLAKEPGRERALALGAWAGFLVNAKLLFLLAVAGGGLFLVWTWRREPRRILIFGAWALLTFLPLLAVIPLYNDYRWAASTEAGYGEVRSVFDGSLFSGIWGPLFSPGKSLFLYAPPLVLAVLALPRAWRRCPDLLLAIGLTVLPVFLLYARFRFWSGDWAWGPRYHVFAVPVLLLPAVVVFDDLIREGRRTARALAIAALGAAVAAGLFVNVLGNSFYWDHWIRMSRMAARDWLGRPNLAGSSTFSIPVNCGACFEEMYPMQWLPPFSPLGGHLWFLRHIPKHDPYEVGIQDAPWTHYTSVALDVRKDYGRARLDWWYLDWEVAVPGLGKGILRFLEAGTLLSLLATILLARRQARAP